MPTLGIIFRLTVYFMPSGVKDTADKTRDLISFES